MNILVRERGGRLQQYPSNIHLDVLAKILEKFLNVTLMFFVDTEQKNYLQKICMILVDAQDLQSELYFVLSSYFDTQYFRF